MASKGRNWIEWGCWNEVAKATGIKRKKPNKIDSPEKIKKRAKFAKCPKCGGQMTYIPESNILICENQIEKEACVAKEDGTVATEKKTVTCGYLNLVDKKYAGYVNYLFN